MTEIKTDVKINTCLIDAFTMTFRGCTPHDIIALLGLPKLDWELDSGRYGYRKAMKFGAITIMYDGIVPNMGVCLYLLGRGVEELSNLTQNRSIFYSLPTSTCYDARLTRIDLDCDDYIGYLSMGTIRDKANSKEVRTRLTKKWQVNGLGDQDGHTIYFGVRQSECMIRFYDKRAEQHTNYHWIRAELVLRHSQAELFRKVVRQELDSASGELDKQVALLGRRVLAGKAEFLERTKDSNISRWPVCRWWTDFLEGCVPIRLSADNIGVCLFAGVCL